MGIDLLLVIVCVVLAVAFMVRHAVRASKRRQCACGCGGKGKSCCAAAGQCPGAATTKPGS